MCGLQIAFCNGYTAQVEFPQAVRGVRLASTFVGQQRFESK
jgi:hypothetical protein